LADATLTVDTYIVRGAGVVKTPSETWEVIPGDVKFNLAIRDWDWCGETSTCAKGQANEVGAFIDVGIAIKGASEAKGSGSGGKSFAIGGGVSLELSNSVLIDGQWTTMPEGYPLVTTQGSATNIVFRFPKFTTSADYDPLIQKSAATPSLADVYDETGAWIGPNLFNDAGIFIGSEEDAALYASFFSVDEDGTVSGFLQDPSLLGDDDDGNGAFSARQSTSLLALVCCAALSLV
jgi:hypothetical protein